MESSQHSEPQSFSAFLFRKAKTYGDRIALINANTGTSWTFNEITASVERLSSALKKRGLKSPDVVSLIMNSTVDVVIAQYAVLATGATVSIAKPMSTNFELQQHFIDCNSRFVITTASLLDKVLEETTKVGDSCGERVFVVDETESDSPRVESMATLMEDDGSAACLFDETIVQDGKRHVAYLPYSSGTTGPPKGVMLSHYSFRQSLEIPCFLELRFEPVIAAIPLPMFHISGLMLTRYCLFNGCTMLLIPPPFDTRTFLTHCSKYKANNINIVPQLLAAICELPDIHEFDLTNWRLVAYGGSPLSVTVEKKLEALLNEAGSAAEITQLYGMTEVSGIAVEVPHGRLKKLPNKEGSVGIPRPTFELQIVTNEEGPQIATAHQSGEIWLRQRGMMLGYLNRPDATAENLTSDGWLKTGDIGYVDEDGYLFIVGRKKEMFHCNGNQVAPAEVESVILLHPGVREAAVCGLPHSSMGEVAVAFVVKSSEDLTEEDVKSLVAEKLSPFKHLHGGVHFVDHIPRTSIGKVQRPELLKLLSH